MGVLSLVILVSLVLPIACAAPSPGDGESHVMVEKRGLYEDNLERYHRIDHLWNDCSNLMSDISASIDAMQESSAYYQGVLDEYAQILGFEDMGAMEVDVRFWMHQANSTLADGADTYQELEEDRQAYTLGSKITGVIGGISFLGTAGLKQYMKVAYNVPFFSSGWNYVDKMVCYRANNFALRELQILETEFMNGNIGREAYMARKVNLEDAGRNPGFDMTLWDQDTVEFRSLSKTMSTASTLSRLNTVLDVVDFGSIFVEIGLWIYEYVQNIQAKEQLNSYIRELAPARFSLVFFKKLVDIWDDHDNGVIDAIQLWNTQQKDADEGVSGACYKENAKEQLAFKIEQGFAGLLEKLSQVTNETIWEEVMALDEARENMGISEWLHNDPSFESVVQAVYENEENAPPNTGDQSTSYQVASPPQSLPADRVNGTNLVYVELEGDQGALWKLFGPFWSYQEASDLEEEAGIRHRYQELARTDDTVELKLVNSDGQTVENGKELTLDTSTNKATWSEGTIMDLVPTSRMNLIPTNGWTVFKAVNRIDHPARLNYTSECNREAGWQIAYNKTMNRPDDTGLFEYRRTKTEVGIARYEYELPDPFTGEGGGRFIDYPQVLINLEDMEALSMTFDYSNRVREVDPMDPAFVHPRVYID